MKRISLAIIFACCMLTLAAQDAIRVNFKGANPTITDFALAFLADDDDEECDTEATAGVQNALDNYINGLEQDDDVTFTVDEKNGYILYEWRSEDSDYMIRTEMCYWNEADKKHKLFAYNSWLFKNGKPASGQYDGIIFCRYDNATKKMIYCNDPGFESEYFNTTYSLPRTGKDIIVTKWNEDGTKTEKVLKWNGRKFSY